MSTDICRFLDTLYRNGNSLAVDAILEVLYPEIFTSHYGPEE